MSVEMMVGSSAVVRRVIGFRGVVVQDRRVEAVAAHDVQGVGVEEFLLGQVVLAGHVECCSTETMARLVSSKNMCAE